MKLYFAIPFCETLFFYPIFWNSLFCYPILWNSIFLSHFVKLNFPVLACETFYFALAHFMILLILVSRFVKLSISLSHFAKLFILLTTIYETQYFAV